MRWFRRFISKPESIDPRLWREVRDRVAWVRGLDPERDVRLNALAARFLREKSITTAGDLRLEESQCALLAALACLPLLEFGAEGLRGWSEMIVYPDAFRVRRDHVDAAGVFHSWDDELSGEAWEAGPLILSWADIRTELDEPDAGFCVVAHEMAHKLDLLDGVLDGTPPLPRTWQRQWARDFQRAYDAFVERIDCDEETDIDPYAAEAPDEFFAVCTEYHFSAPWLLERDMPEVAAHLARFYGRSPSAR